MHRDTLSEVLNAVRLSGGMFVQGQFSAPYAITATDREQMLAMFAPNSDYILPFHLITEGSLWVAVAGGDTVQLNEGDIIVLPHGAGHTLRDQPGAGSVRAGDLQDHMSGPPPTLTYGGQGETARVLCGFFNCRGRVFNPLIDALPQVIVVRRDSIRSPWLAATLQRTFNEFSAARPGGAALVERLVELLFLDVVQSHLEDHDATGWLAGLADEAVGSVLNKIHSDPANNWTVEELAKEAAVSRSVLAERFSSLVGMSPIKYLISWRMELASQRLLHTTDGIAQIATDVGYDSEASFNRAFKRHLNEPPAAWRSAQRANRGDG